MAAHMSAKVLSTKQSGFLVLLPLLILSACATLPRNPVPLDGVYSAEVPGMPGMVYGPPQPPGSQPTVGDPSFPAGGRRVLADEGPGLS